MTIHYHGTPITPVAVFMTMTGKHFCVSHAYPQDVERAHKIGQSVMLDNGAFSKWRTGKATDWASYYDWADRWLNYPTTWAVIPDEIAGNEQAQDALIAQWPHGDRGVPVWHLHESVDRALCLLDKWPRVCFGSSAEYSYVGGPAWRRRMDEAFNAIAKRHRRTPWVHMLRGMQCAKWGYPFASIDSADVARNHNGNKLTAREMADRWDAMQCPPAMIEMQEGLFDAP